MTKAFIFPGQGSQSVGMGHPRGPPGRGLHALQSIGSGNNAFHNGRTQISASRAVQPRQSILRFLSSSSSECGANMTHSGSSQCSG